MTDKELLQLMKGQMQWGLDELVAWTGLDEEELQDRLDTLVLRGFVFTGTRSRLDDPDVIELTYLWKKDILED